MTKTFTTLASAFALSLAMAPAAFADASDFAGFYAGFELGNANLENSFGLPLQSAHTGGVFVGYNHAVTPDIIVGAELSYGLDRDHQIAPGVTFAVEGPLELGARAGYVFGNSMVYATLGYTWADFTQTGAPFSESFEGMSYGLGLETLVSDTISLRIEYSHTTYNTGGLIYASNLDFASDAVSIGVAFHF